MMNTSHNNKIIPDEFINFTLENLSVVFSGEDYFSRLEQLINESQNNIYIQVYIFEYDYIGLKIAATLKKAALRGVKIYLLVDGFGSNSLPDSFIEELKISGIHFRFFSPFFSINSFYIGRRLHQKVVVIDSKISLIGGINIADKYYGSETQTPWLDYAILIKNEKIAKPLQSLCHDIYYKNKFVYKTKIDSLFYNSKDISVRILQNDWLKRKNEIHKSYHDSICNAKNEIIIVGSYFLPGKKLTNALIKATQKNVTVKLILSGISDVPLLRYATLYYYSKILNYNFELYEWEKSILHGKSAVIDNYWTTIGSFNLNNLSSYASIEMNVEIKSAKFAQAYATHLNEIILQCTKITLESTKKNGSHYTKFRNWLCYKFIIMILSIITYFPYKRL